MNDPELLIVLATVGGTVVVAVISTILTYRFTRRTRLESAWRVDKLEHYRQLLLVLPLLQRPQPDKDFQTAVDRLIEVTNALYLVAPFPIIKSLKHIVDEFKKPLEKRTSENVFDPLIRLMRKDLKVTSGVLARIRSWFNGRGFELNLLYRTADQA